MHHIFYLLIAVGIFYQCKPLKTNAPSNTSSDNISTSSNDTIRITNSEAAYDIIIIEPGFAVWLLSQQPKENFTSDLLAIRNRLFVAEWNRRVQQPTRYRKLNLYEQEINYFPTVDYGLEVNYKLFMYFKFFQEKYNQNLLQ
jgi:hypothetical protein